MAIMLVISVVYADEIKTASASAHYSHPITGKINDAGKNPEIGQSMVESVLYPYALFEQVGDNTFLSIRLGMSENLSDVKFRVQEKSEDEFYEVEFIQNEFDDETMEYKFPVKSEDSVVEVLAYVDAMGREVDFFIDFSDFSEGNTDFKTLSDLESEGKNPLAELKIMGVVENSDIESVGFEPAELGYEHGLLTKNSPELADVEKMLSTQESGQVAIPDSEVDSKVNPTKWGSVTIILFSTFMVVIGLISVFMFILAIVMFFYYKKLKLENESLEDVVDEV